MYKLFNQKASLLSQVKVMGEGLEESIARYKSGQDVTAFQDAIAERDKKIKDIEQVNRQIAFLEESGYQPGREEAEQVALEQGTIAALAGLITKGDQRVSEGLKGIQAELAEGLREVREGQRSIHAYFPMLEEDEGRKVDTFR